MKIVHLTNTYPGVHAGVGGAEYECWRLCEKLSSAGHEITVLTTAFDKKPPPDEPRPSGYAVESLPTLEKYLGSLARYSEVLKWYIFQFDPFSFFAAWRRLGKIRPDVVHLHNVYILTFMPLLAAKMLGIPVVYSIYDYWQLCPLCILYDYNVDKICRRFHGSHCVKCLPPVMRFAQTALLFFRKKFFDFFLDKVDKYVVLSESSRGILLDYGISAARILVAPLTLPDEFARDDAAGRRAVPAPESASVLYIGWLQKRKGLHVLLDAMEIVWKEIPSAKLYVKTRRVKWEDDYADAAMERISRYGRQKCVLISGYIPRDEVGDYIARSTVVVILEQWENMSPLLMMEAMHTGKPVVAGNIGGIPEFIEHGVNGLLCRFDDPRDYAANIIRLLKNPAEAAGIASRAKERIREFVASADPVGRIASVYSSLKK